MTLKFTPTKERGHVAETCGPNERGCIRTWIGAGLVRGIFIEGAEFELVSVDEKIKERLHRKGEREGVIGWESPTCKSGSERISKKAHTPEVVNACGVGTRGQRMQSHREIRRHCERPLEAGEVTA